MGPAIAGCLGNGNGDVDDDDADDDVDDNGSEGDDPTANFPEFDPDAEPFPELPQLTSDLFPHGLEMGHPDDLELFEERDEPIYGDPVQEIDDDTEILDPDPLVFAIHPVEDPAIYESAVEPMMDNLRAETGKEIEFHPLANYASQVEAMRAERLHIASFATGVTPFATNMAGFEPRVVTVGDDAFGYRLWTVTRTDNTEINELEDLQGLDVAHASETSNSGHLMPAALLEEDFGISAGEDYEIHWSGGHDQSFLGVEAGDYDAAHIAATVMGRAYERGDVDGDALKTIYASDPIVPASWGPRYNLDPDLKESIVSAFVDYDYEGTAFEEEWGDRYNFTEIDYATHWHNILVTHQTHDVEYVEEDL